MGEANEAPPLTVLRVVPAAAVAANVLDLLPDVTVDRKGHVVVVLRILAVPLLVAQRHDFDQAERLFLGLLHRHGRVFSAPRGKPGAVHDGGRGVHRRVIGRLEHYRDAERREEKKRREKKTGMERLSARRYDGVGSDLKGPSIESNLTYCGIFHQRQSSRFSLPGSRTPLPEIPVCVCVCVCVCSLSVA